MVPAKVPTADLKPPERLEPQGCENTFCALPQVLPSCLYNLKS